MTRLEVLLVEDDAEDAHHFARLAPADFRVDRVTSAVTARTAAARREYDLAFVDYRLGPDDGLEVVRTLRQRRPTLPVIVITGQDVGALGENALLAGATDFVPKDSLSRPVIERAARWALIRRHVTRRAADDASSAVLQETLRRSPPPRTAPEPLRRLVYLSHARTEFDPPRLLGLCSRAAAANARIGVTGVLVLAGDRFMQVLEGEPVAVGTLLDRIAADPRHGDLAVVRDGPAGQRLYGDWNMGYLQLGERAELMPPAWAALARTLGRELGALGDDRPGLDGLIARLPLLLRSARPDDATIP